MTEGPNTPKAHLTIGFDDVALLASDLGNEGMGYAIRLLAYEARFGQGILDESAPTYLGISRRKWNAFAGRITAFFHLKDARWVALPRITPPSPTCTPTITPNESTAVVTPALPMPATQDTNIQPTPYEAPSTRRTTNHMDNGQTIIQGVQPRHRKQVSIFNGIPIIPGAMASNSPTQALYQTAQVLFMSNGRMTEGQARACLTNILKDNPKHTGLIFEAINEAWKLREEILDPYPWVVKRISNKKREADMASARPQNQGSRQRVETSKEAMGISDERLEIMRKRSKNRPTFMVERIKESA